MPASQKLAGAALAKFRQNQAATDLAFAALEKPSELAQVTDSAHTTTAP
jgi:hypothetical protein